MAARDVHDRIHIRRAAGEVHSDDGFGFIRNLFLHGLRVERVAVGIEIGKDRNGVLEQNADDGAHIGDRRGDDLIAGRHTADAERHMHSRRAGGRRHTVRHIIDFREFLRE